MGALPSQQRPVHLINVGPQSCVEVNILILGAAAAGKTTLFRQIKCSAKCAPLRRECYRNIILFNLWEVFVNIANACDSRYPNDCKLQRNLEIATRTWYNHEVPNEIIQAMLDLRKDETVMNCLNSMRRATNLQNVNYFLENIERFTAVSFIPTEEDILNSYAPTVGIDYIKYKVANTAVSVTDIGGNEFCRRHWKELYTDVTLMIFIVDVTAFSAGTVNVSSAGQEDESVGAFVDLCGNAILKRAHFMLIFNKKDVFDEQQSPQGGAPPGGTDQTALPCMSLMMVKARFLRHVTSRKIYQHTVSLLSRRSLENTVMESINAIAKRNRMPTAL